MQFDRLTRREFISLLGGAAAAWPRAARAQQRAMPVIGYLALGTLDTTRETVAEFHRGLSEIGYVEGRNLAVEYRWAEYHSERLAALAEDLARRQVDVIIALTIPAALAAKAATKSIPVVFQVAVDPVEAGLVTSLNRPDGNLTGISILLTALVGKRLELMRELTPGATSIAYLVNPERGALDVTETRELQVAARILGVRLLVLNTRDPSEFEAAFATIVREGAGGLLVSGYQFFGRYSDRLVELAARHRVPVIYATRAAPSAGGLMSYGPANLEVVWRQEGLYAGRILKGEKPANLPVQQVTKIELVVNLNTARALGLTVPPSILIRAEEVIE
jgi:putative ABC transport system substrate-binding protein